MYLYKMLSSIKKNTFSLVVCEHLLEILEINVKPTQIIVSFPSIFTIYYEFQVCVAINFEGNEWTGEKTFYK